MEQPYSDTWFDTFLFGMPAERTAVELAFLQQQLPRASFSTVLDVCCGAGRHARGLAAAGYVVTAIDRHARPLARAVKGCEGDMAASSVRVRSPFFVRADMRALPVAGPFDAALIMWQSFGYFDAATNHRILRDLRSVLRDEGRLILDIYDRRFFESRQGTRVTVRDGREITEHKRLDGDRLHVELRYGGSDVVDRIDWQVFTPDEIADAANEAGFGTTVQCARFDERAAPDPSEPRMQVVLQSRP